MNRNIISTALIMASIAVSGCTSEEEKQKQVEIEKNEKVQVKYGYEHPIYGLIKKDEFDRIVSENREISKENVATSCANYMVEHKLKSNEGYLFVASYDSKIGITNVKGRTGVKEKSIIGDFAGTCKISNKKTKDFSLSLQCHTHIPDTCWVDRPGKDASIEAKERLGMATINYKPSNRTIRGVNKDYSGEYSDKYLPRF